MACSECELLGAESAVRGVAPIRRGPFVVHPREDGTPVRGWWIVAPKRHVEQIDELSSGESAALGILIREVVAALRAETGAEKVYVSVFAEVLHHLHVHVIAREKDLAEDERGARIFLSTSVAERRAVEELATRVHARLSGSARN